MESCKRFVLEGGLQTPSPLSVIKAGFRELTEHKEPLFGKVKILPLMLVNKEMLLILMRPSVG